MNARVVVGISGASGSAIGVRIVQLLAELGASVDLVISSAAEQTIVEELGHQALAAMNELPARRYSPFNMGASIASGSSRTSGMIVAPCSMRTLSAIAHSLSDNLLVRAADVHLKERRPLILIARETPLHLGHLRAMTAVTEMGAIVMPPVPAFYLKPVGIGEIIDQIARRAVDALHIAPATARAWDGGLGAEKEKARAPASRPRQTVTVK
ncbi:UbiX family flavin prenyltransferase [Nitratireductor sp. ZSWI3]|uniref:UbiX family flavin prenyltransferase n=1 Tax=Nitratireductor sp. ZSWI3 TaxID=2966359 RepID=UPI002150152E|nr:UbiX family flavin prenyltransferase [Nitratireductor sp. ZSWI3]MCR4265248.1 UbiX family flavin prenyltransferase [Nitratireductor sp. ZSWI3]